MERVFFAPQQSQPTEHVILLLLGAVNDVLQELGVPHTKAISFQRQAIFLQAASPAIRAIVSAQREDISERTKKIYHRRGGNLIWKKIVVRVGTN